MIGNDPHDVYWGVAIIGLTIVASTVIIWWLGP